MKRFVIVSSVFVLAVVAGCSIFLHAKRDMATIACIPLDHGTRTRDYCIMNPFRDRNAENEAERILEQLKAGNTNVLIPYLSEKDADDRERYLSNECEYKITSWHNGEIEANDQELSIQYWVSRSNYPASRGEVHFFFIRTDGQWALRSYNAIY